MDYYKVVYYFINDEEGKMYSLITTDVDGYFNNKEHETGIAVVTIEPSTEREYNSIYGG